MRNSILFFLSLILCHELVTEFVVISDQTSLGLLIPLVAGVKKFGNSQRKKRAEAGERGQGIFTDATKEGVGYFNDMYADDYDLIQSGIGNFKNLAGEISNEAANPYLNSVEGKAFSNQINENTDKSRQRFSNAASSLNLSDEAVVAGMNNINQTEGNSFRGLSANATQRQNLLRGQKMSALAQILTGQNSLLGQKMNASGQGISYGSGATNAYNQRFGFEANRQQANTQAFTKMFSDILGTVAGAAGGGG